MKLFFVRQICRLFNAVDYAGWLSRPLRYFFIGDGITCMQIHITDQCNLSCIYCYAKNHEGRPMQKDKIIGLIDEARVLGVKEVQLVGGEPFMHPDLDDIIDSVVKRRMIVTVYTNGLLINRRWIRKLKGYGNKVALAIKFDSREGYKRHIGKDLHQKVCESIRLCRKEGIITFSFITLTRFNKDDLHDLLGKTISYDSIPILERYLPARNCKTNEELSVSALDWKEALIEYDSHMGDYKDYMDAISRVLGCNCSCYGMTLSIDTDGDVLPCPYSPKSQSLGNVKSEGLRELFYRYVSMREEWDKIPTGCTSCSKRDRCKGGCKTYSYLTKGSCSEKDPYCTMNEPNKTMLAFTIRRLK